MKSNEINAIFAAKTAEYLNAGYQINTNTMNGSQGEIAKIDFRKGNEVIRVLLKQETIWGESFRTSEAVVLTIGRCTDERVINEVGFSRSNIIWNERLEVIEKRVFLKMGSNREADWYLEGKDAEVAMQKHYERITSRFHVNQNEGIDYNSDAVKKILLPAVRRHLGKPHLKLNRIAKVTRHWENNRFEYTVLTLAGNRAVLH